MSQGWEAAHGVKPLQATQCCPQSQRTTQPVEGAIGQSSASIASVTLEQSARSLFNPRVDCVDYTLCLVLGAADSEDNPPPPSLFWDSRFVLRTQIKPRSLNFGSREKKKKRCSALGTQKVLFKHLLNEWITAVR